MAKKTPDEYFADLETWAKEMATLRKIIASTGLVEEIKWGAPCYAYNGKNVVGLLAFKSYFGLWFHQGALLKDEAGVLMNAQSGVTRALRQWRMADKKEIKARLVKAYVKEAIALVDAGAEIKPNRTKPLVVPPELKAALANDKAAKAAFDAMSKSKQREYADHVASAKQDATKARRLDKVIPMIAAGKGLNDKYR